MDNGLFVFRPVHTECAWWAVEGGDRIFAITNLRAKIGNRAVLLLPPFGMSSANLIIPAIASADIGCRALRFDGRCNVGLSSGEIIDFKLGLLLDDARLAAAKLVEATGADDFVIVGMSISSPVALKLASEFPRSRLVLLAPAIDICHTIERAAGNPNLFDGYRSGDPDAAPIHKVMGHDVRVGDFYRDLTGIGLADVEDVLTVAQAVRGRADLILPEKDEFTVPEMKVRLIEALGAGERSLMIQGMGHDLGRSPGSIKAAFNFLVDAVQDHYGVPESERKVLPPEAALIAAAKLDRAMIESFLKAPSRSAEPAGQGARG